MRKIPLYLQPENSVLCGPTVLKMVLEYFNIYKEIEEISNQMEIREKQGTSLANLGTYLLKNNFNVTLYCLDTKNFNYKIADNTSSVQIQKMEECIEKNGENKIISETISYIQNGGILNYKLITILELKNLMESNILICRVDAAIFWRDRNAVREAMHFIVPIEIKEETIVVNDPSPLFGGVKEYPLKEFEAAFISAKSYFLMIPEIL